MSRCLLWRKRFCCWWWSSLSSSDLEHRWCLPVIHGNVWFFHVFFISKLNKILLERHWKDKDIHYMSMCCFFWKVLRVTAVVSLTASCHNCVYFHHLLPSPSHWMAQDDTLPVLVLSTFLYPNFKNIEFHLVFLYKTWLRNMPHATSPGRSQGLGRGLRALWWTENRWRAKLQTREAAAKWRISIIVRNEIETNDAVQSRMYWYSTMLFCDFLWCIAGNNKRLAQRKKMATTCLWLFAETFTINCSHPWQTRWRFP